MNYKKITEEELQEILEEHKKWLDSKYVLGKRADLNCTNLSNIDLSNANLSQANLCYANLFEANLKNTNLSEADLNKADLSWACLYNANLYGANLKYANLYYSYLYGADLTDVDLEGASVYNTAIDIDEEYRLGYIAKEDFIGYKKLRDDLICELTIPKGAVVFSINGKKCRTNKVKVNKIYKYEDGKRCKYSIGRSSYKRLFIYKVGKVIEVEDFNLIYNRECATGIHFFKTEKEAIDYEL